MMLYCVFALYEQCNIQNAELMKKVLENVASYNVHSSLLVGVPPLIILLIHAHSCNIKNEPWTRSNNEKNWEKTDY